MRVLVTGANGFVGRAAVRRLAEDGGFSLAILTRNPGAWNGPGEALDVAADIDAPAADFGNALVGVDAILHLAARSAGRDEAVLQRANRQYTAQLARAAAAAGVRRFVFVSSIKVNGESTAKTPFTAADIPAPQDAYGRSKRDAENDLRAIASETGLEIVIVRPPLVMGPGVKGNLRAMAKAVAKGLPLPVGAFTDNRRDLVGLSDLADLLAVVLRHERAAGRVFVTKSGSALSTVGLVQALGAALGRKPRLVNVPQAILRAATGIAGLGAAFDRLAGNLEVDDTETRRLLDWTPPAGLDVEFARFAEGLKAAD